MSIIRYTFFSHDNLKIRINDFNEYLQNYSNQQGYVWIDLFDPIFEDLIILRNHFNLHHLSIDDCMDENQLPKCEDFSNYTFVIFNNFYYKNNNLSIEEINIFLGKNYIITIHGRNYPEYDFFDKFYDTSVSV